MCISQNIKISYHLIYIYFCYFIFKDGDFLVRESQGSPGQYVLTGMNNNIPKHLLLIDPEGVVSMKIYITKFIHIAILLMQKLKHI